MKPSRWLGLYLLALPFLGGCRSSTIFYADFESDTVGQAPATSPPGNPKGDILGTVGATVVEKLGLPPSVVNRKQLHLVADADPTSVSCTFKRNKNLTKPFYGGGKLVVIWSGWTFDPYGRPMIVEAQNNEGEAVARIKLHDGAFEVEGAPGFQNGYEGGDPHTASWSFDLTSKKVWFTVNLGEKVEMTKEIDLLAPLKGGLKRIHFGFAAEPAPHSEGSYHFETINATWARASN